MTANNQESDLPAPDSSDESPSEGALTISDRLPELRNRVASELGIPQEKAEQAVQIVASSVAAYRGPIPLPNQVEAYNRISAGLGTRLVDDHLIQRKHDRTCEREAIVLAKSDSSRKDGWLMYARRGQNYGLISQVLMVAGALFCAFTGHVVLAGGFIAGPALGVVAHFIQGVTGKETQKEDAMPTKSDEEDEH